MGTLWDDLIATVRTLVRVPWLLPVALAVAGVTLAATTLLMALPLLGLMLSWAWYVAALGWLGAEHVVFAQDSRDVQVQPSDAVHAVVRLAPPFVRLALVLVPLGIPVIVAVLGWGVAAPGTRIVMFLAVCVSLLVWSFTGPPIVLTTLRVRGALSIAWRLVRGSWAEVWGHVLVLSVALAGLSTAATIWHPIAGLAVGTLGGLLVRGATTRRYITLVDVWWDQVPGTEERAKA